VALSGGGLVVGGSAASASSKSTAKTTTKKTLKKFEKCLKKHGVKISLPGSGGPAGGSPSGTFPFGGGAPGGFKVGKKFQKAIKACSHLLPAGSQFGGGSGSPPTGSTAFAAFRNCMTLQHVTLAKGSYGAKSSSSAVTSTSSSKYKKAYSACSSLLPKSPPTST
jgi:hypothetical protein